MCMQCIPIKEQSGEKGKTVKEHEKILKKRR